MYHSKAKLKLQLNQHYVVYLWPVPIAARSNAWVCGRSLAGIAGSNPANSRVLSLVSAVCYPVGVFCVGLITRPEESYRAWCECDREENSY